MTDLITTSKEIRFNSFHLGDCYEYMKLLPDKSVNLIFCDLPYGETSNPMDKPLFLADYIEMEVRKNRTIKMDFETFCVFAVKKKMDPVKVLMLWNDFKQDGLWTNFNRILRQNGNIVLFGQGNFISTLVKSNEKQYKYDIIWNKVLISGQLNSPYMPLRQHESLLVFNNGIRGATYNQQYSEGKPLHSKGKNFMNKPIVNNNYGKVRHTEDLRKGSTQKFPTTIWTYPKTHPSKALYRTEKPVALLERGVRTFSNPGDLVLDCTAGSGGLAEACAMSGRNWILMDKEQEALDAFIKRVNQAPLTLELFSNIK